MSTTHHHPFPDLYEDLVFRGLVKQTTHEDFSSHLKREPLTLYCGFDPTADALHIGHLLPILTLRRFQQAGHRIIAVAGGATGMIGDPSGKSQERSLLTEETLQHNVKSIQKTLARLLDFSSEERAVLVNNADWFRSMSYTEFLRTVGKHFTVNHMLAKESVRARLEDRDHGISYTEFSYMLLQAYDFYRLYKDHGCTLQIGGSDQWGNITAGIELTRRMEFASGRESGELFGLTFPLVSKADGTKFGKTESGTVWLSAEKTSPYQLYQFLIQTQDADVIPFLKYFTFLPHTEILALEKQVHEAPEKRTAQQRLAEELVKLIHGEDSLEAARKASQALFSEDLSRLDESTLADVLSEAPRTSLSSQQILGKTLTDLVAEVGLIQSKGQARKDIAAGGVYLNNTRETDPNRVIQSSDLIAGRNLILRKGKKNYLWIQIS